MTPVIFGEKKGNSLSPALPPTFPDEGSPELILADVGGSPAEILDDFRHLHSCKMQSWAREQLRARSLRRTWLVCPDTIEGPWPIPCLWVPQPQPVSPVGASPSHPWSGRRPETKLARQAPLSVCSPSVSLLGWNQAYGVEFRNCMQPVC